MGGDFSAFWPEGIVSSPWALVLATNLALQVISWHENLPRDEQPPRHIWWSEDLLASWFRNVQEGREAKSTKRSSYDDAEDVPMEQNELAAQYRPR